MTSIITFIKTYWKVGSLIPIVLAILIFLWKFYSLSCDYHELQEEYTILTTKYEDLHVEYTKLQLAQLTKESELSSVNQLLENSYQHIDQRTKDLLEIDSIMSSPESTVSGTTENMCSDSNENSCSVPYTSKEENYVPVSSSQNTSGIEFIHRQFDNLK